MNKNVFAAGLTGLLASFAPGAPAQDAGGTAAAVSVRNLEKVQVIDHLRPGYAADAQYHRSNVDLGPLGNQSILTTPLSLTVVPESLIVNQQAKTVNDVLRNLPSVEIRDQQGLEVSRPQSRGFQGTIVQNTRMDGLNVIGTTAIPAENLSGIDVLNGFAGSLYGPQTPAGVFNYILKRPTTEPLLRFIESYDSNALFTEQIDVGGMAGPGNQFGYRLNLVHGEGEGYVSGSASNRTLLSGAFDYHLDSQTVLETNFSHYTTDVTGLPGSVVYASGKSTFLPRAVDPTRAGLGQPGAGTTLVSDTEVARLRHDFGNGWTFEVGGLYENAVRNLYGITNTFVDNSGNYRTTKNFTAVPRFTIASNSARLDGHFDALGLTNDLSIGTNGFTNGQYSYVNSIAVPLGSANISHPVIYPARPTPDSGGQYRSGSLTQQSIVVGDTLHFNDQWAVQAVVNASYISAKSYAASGVVKTADSRDAAISPTVSLLYRPTPQLSTYATFSRSIEQGESAPAGTANANDYLAPYHDTQYEVGAKYAFADDFLVTLDAFRMERPLADTSATTNVFAVVGTQRNVGVELFAQGNLTAQVSILGGVTYINARLLDTGVASTNDKLVVGVPHVKTDVSIDYHPGFATGYALTGTAHFESERAATNTSNSFAPSYATYDVGARYSTRLFAHAATLRAQVINLTDKNYYSSVADGNIVGSPGANTAYYGAPRTLLVSLEVDL